MSDESTMHSPRPVRGGRAVDGQGRAPASAGRSARGAGWWVPAGLVALSLVPVVAGAMRLNELIGGAAVTADNARYFASPLPVVLHIVSVTIYSILGALQFAPRFRRRRPGWHRAAGRLLIPCGLLAAVTGMWMALFYPPTVNDSGVLVVMRVVVGTAMAGCILLGLAAVRRRDFARHQAWMVRGYALGMGAGTQLLTHLPWFVLYGTPDSFPRAVLMGAGWLINIVVAEWVLRRRRPQLRTRLVS
ncbi:DUF2306 domain-containing protein [Sphaerisporangium melleum]|nr:DUF2306 domain-containing protein [Sphaerisporangium melleum]